MDASIEEASAESINEFQTQIAGTNYQRFLKLTSDTLMAEIVSQDVNVLVKPHDSSPCVDVCPEVRYLNEHLVTTDGFPRTSQYIDPMCDVFMSQSAIQDHIGLAKSQVSFGGVDDYRDVNTPDEHLMNTDDCHMTPKLIEPVCDVFMSQSVYQDNHGADNFPDLQYLDKHLVTQIKEEQLTLPQYNWHECHACFECIEGFVDEHQLTAHMTTHAEENHPRSTYFGTEEYSLNFQNVLSIEEPFMPYTKEKPHKCPVCSIGFWQIFTLEQHMLIHNSNIPKLSPQYGDNSRSLRGPEECQNQHTKTIKKTRIKCSACARTFSRRKHLKVHMKSHRAKKPYKCPLCKKEFKHSHSWTAHFLTHTGEKLYKCYVCSQRFTRSSSLKNHMMTHRGETGQSKNSCSVCKKEFKRSSHLRRHFLNKHSVIPATKEPPKLVQYKWDECHDCSQCIDGFTHEHELTAHMLTHSEPPPQRPSVWRSAGYVSNSQETLSSKENMKNAKQKPHKCSVCGIRFLQILVYHQHMLLHKTAIPTVSSQYGNDLISPRDFKEGRNQDIKVTKKKSLKCSHCSSKFSQQKHLKIHMETHKGKRLYKCSTCSEEFSHLTDLRKHVSTHSGDKLYMCSLCNKRFKRSSSLKKHIVMHKGGKRYKCSVCRKEFSSLSHMKKHVLRQHSVVQTKEALALPQYRWTECQDCPHCIKGFTQDHELTAHMAAHKVEIRPQPCVPKVLSTKKLHKCSHCDKEFSKRKDMKQHMLMHPGDSPYKCLVCNKGFTRSSRLDKHMMIHTEEKPHKCSMCSKKFRRSKSLRSHMKQHLVRSEIKQFHNMFGGGVNPTEGTSSKENSCQKCRHCGLLFSSLSKLKIHKKIHKVRIDTSTTCEGFAGRGGTNTDLQTPLQKVSASSSEYEGGSADGTHTCPICKKEFKRTSSFKDHMMTHSEPLQCPVCKTSFRDVSDLRRHMMHHTTGNPPKCSVCNQVFSCMRNLRRHMMLHTGVKPHMCEVCNKCFRRSSNLHEHMMVHTGYKPHECSVCNKGFKRSDQLRTHMMKHTGRKPHEHSVRSEMSVHSAEQYIYTTGNAHTTLKQHHCTLCNRSYRNFSKFVSHMEMHTQEKINETGQRMRKEPQEYKCDLCKKLFKNQTVLDRHTAKWTCTSCEQGFCKLSYLNNHMKTHNGEHLKDSSECPKLKTCYICSKEFATVSAFTSHMLFHTRPKGYMCYICSRFFRQLVACQKHMQFITRKQSVQCRICNKKFRDMSSLKIHIRCHETYTYPCTQCVQRFRSIESLMEHKCYPEGNEYHCCHCQKSFTCLSRLIEHVSEIQTGTEMYVCMQCGKWFLRQEDLDKHFIFSHAKWSCSHCTMGFSLRNGLKRHLYSHVFDISTTVHICSVCKKGFSTTSAFRDHVVTHTGQDYTDCVKCVRGFLQTSDLESHLAVHLDLVN